MASIVQESTQVVVDGAETEPDGYSYKIDLYTGDTWGAGTDANVLVTIYGEDGDSGQHILDNSGNNFERDSKDHFKIINKTYLGRIKKITIGHDNSGAAPGWFLKRVTVEDVKSREVFEFLCDRWFSTDEDDGFTSRDLTWTNVTIKEKQKGDTYPYTINIYTGNEWGAGTDANVHVTVYGTKADSGEQQFQNKGKETFEGGMKNSYNIETSESLGTLYKVRVGHDNTGWGPGWFLDKIEVEDDSTGEVIEFKCGKWLATDSEDGLIRRDLMREGFVEEVDSPHENVTYTVDILTGNDWGAGTDSNIYFTLYGTAGESEQQTIVNEGSTTFECGMTDTYEFECPYLGTLTKIRIGHDNTGWGPAWQLDKVTVEDSKSHETVVFPCNRWLATNADDGMIERELKREGMFGDNIIIEGVTEGLKGEPLGMESHEVKDDKITASSYADDTPPFNARLNNTAGWCAKEAEGCWLQVDMEDIYCITSIATQGNPGGNQDYVKKYKIQYSLDGEKWTTHEEENGNQIFDANVDNTSVKTNDLHKVVVTRFIRICPVEWYCWPCLRIEVYGVPLKEGGTEVRTVSYVTEQVIVTHEDEEVESVPDDKDEQHKAEDAVKFILSQTGDKRKDLEEQKKRIDDEMKKLEEERKEREKRKEEERKRMEEEERREEEEEKKKREEEEKRKEMEEEERKIKVELEVKKIEEEHKQRLDDLEKKMREDEEKRRKELEEKKKTDEEELKRMDDEIEKDEEIIKQHKETRERYEEKLKELQSAGIIKTETTTETIPSDDGVETITITRQIIVESSIDDGKKDEDDEEHRQREKEEKERERQEKIKRMREEEERRQQEEKDFNEIMLQMRIKAEGEDAEKKEKEEEEERKRKEEAKKIKEKEDKERQEREEKKKKKEEEKARRRAEREKKRILLETKKMSSTDSLSSLSSTSSSSSSEEEDVQLSSKVETTDKFKAPIASVDEDDDSVTKVVTYRTHTTTTTRIVSWPGTYFFKPIEPGARQQPLPEDVGLLFGVEKSYPGLACCDHLKPIDPAVKTAQEISFEEKLSDNKGPLPSWIDKETPLQLYTPINAIGDEDINKLVEWEKAGTKGWKRTKKSREYEIWTRKAYEGGPLITKAIITLNGIPCDDAIDIIRDWDTRQDWDKTFDKVTVLETIDTSRLVYCPVKKRELFLAVQDRQDTQGQFYASAWKNTAHPKIDNNKNKQLKLYYLVSGLVIRPISSGGSHITILCQVKGSVPSQVKSTFLAANPAKWIDALKKHHANKTKENAAKEE